MCAASPTATCGGANPDARVDSSSPADVALDMFVDVTAPDTIIDSMPPVLDNNATATFTFHSTETGGGFECKHDSGAFAPCTSPDSMTGLTNGLHSFEVRARDASGNLDMTPAKYSWTYDDNMPQTVLDTHPPLNTKTNNGTFTFHCVKPTDTPECKLDSGTFGACTSGTTQTFSGLLDGPHTFVVSCKSPLGMSDPSPESFTWTIDSIPPTTTITTKPPDPTNVKMPVFAFSSQAGSTFECSLDNAPFTPCTSGSTIDASTEGSHTLRVRATDPAGNVETTPVGHTWTLDTVPPTTAFTGFPNAVMQFDFASFTWQSEAGATFECSLDNAAVFTACGTSTMLMNLGETTHTFFVRAKDAAGNTETPAKSFTWRVDLTNPTITFIAPTPMPNDTTGPAVGFSWTTSEAVTTTTCTLDGVTIGGCSTDLDLSVPHGNHTFAITVRDTAGRTGTGTVTWNVTCKLMGTAGPGTIGYFDFDELNGDVLFNRYAGGFNAFNGGAMGADALDATRDNMGRYPGGRSLRFDATRHDTASWPTGIATRQSAITFEVWVNPAPSSAPSTQNLMSTGDNNAQLFLATGSTNPTVHWKITSMLGGTAMLQAGLGVGTWNHVLGAYDSNGLRLWVNGGQVTPVASPGTASIDITTIRWGSNGTDHLDAMLDEPYISVSGFTTGDFRQHYCPLTF